MTRNRYLYTVLRLNTHKPTFNMSTCRLRDSFFIEVIERERFIDFLKSNIVTMSPGSKESIKALDELADHLLPWLKKLAKEKEKNTMDQFKRYIEEKKENAKSIRKSRRNK